MRLTTRLRYQATYVRANLTRVMKTIPEWNSSVPSHGGSKYIYSNEMGYGRSFCLKGVKFVAGRFARLLDLISVFMYAFNVYRLRGCDATSGGRR